MSPALFQSQGPAKDRFKGISLADETKIVRMRRIGGSLGIVSQQIITAKIVKMLHTGRLELLLSLSQGCVVVVMKLGTAGHKPRVGKPPILH